MPVLENAASDQAPQGCHCVSRHPAALPKTRRLRGWFEANAALAYLRKPPFFTCNDYLMLVVVFRGSDAWGTRCQIAIFSPVPLVYKPYTQYLVDKLARVDAP